MGKYYNLFAILIIIVIFFIISLSVNESFRGRGGRGPRGPWIRTGYPGYRYGHIGPRNIYRPGMGIVYPDYRRQFYSYRNYYGDYPLRRNVVVAPVAVPVQTVKEDPWYVSLFTGSLCKTGCTSIGKGEWACQYPGNGINEC